ncbi:MAG: hypothetical protein KDJ38_17525, partial [Gammaproteobacteria bacterium]|nr:hypothetical protein [Gammaproteobacteria bacterium]
MLTRQSLVWISGFFLLLLTGQVNAVETLSADELASHCRHYPDDPTGNDATFCVRYIQGFIDGAIATDERVIENVASELEVEENLSQRAMRTRIGSRIQRYGSSYYAEFCLGAPVALKEVAETVISDLIERENINERLTARGAVYQTLREKYPCEAD